MMSDARLDHGMAEAEAPAEGAEGRTVRRLQAETAGRIALALQDRLGGLVAAWTSRRWNGTSVLIREDVGQGLEVSMEVRRKDGIKRIVELTLYGADHGGKIASFQAGATDEGFEIRHRWVEPAWRGGTGAILLRKLEEFARCCADAQKRPFICETNVGQPDVMEFFARNGFETRDPAQLEAVRAALREGKIMLDDGYMFPAGTEAFHRTPSSLKAIRLTMRKAIQPSVQPPARRKRFGWF